MCQQSTSIYVAAQQWKSSLPSADDIYGKIIIVMG
jgi:hypothetical protein